MLYKTVVLVWNSVSLDFTQDYEELGCLVYGRAIFENGILTDICLDTQDFDSFELDEETDTYHFEGKECLSFVVFLHKAKSGSFLSLSREVSRWYRPQVTVNLFEQLPGLIKDHSFRIVPKSKRSVLGEGAHG